MKSLMKSQTPTQTSAPPQTTLTIPVIINSFTNEIINDKSKCFIIL